MKGLPKIPGEGRSVGIGLITLSAIGQAIAAGIAAFATRDVFAAMRAAGSDVPLTPLSLIVLSGFAIAALRVWERVLAEKVGQNFAASLRLELFEHFSRLPISYVEQLRQGEIALRFVGDLAAVRGWVSSGIARMISSAIVLPAATLVLFLLDPALGVAASVPIFLALAVMAVLAPRLGDVHRRLRARRGGLAADMSERIRIAPELRLMGRMARENRIITHRTDRMVAAAVARIRGASILRSIPDAASGLAIAALLWSANRAGVPAADAAGAIAAVALMIKPMRDLAGVGDRYRAWIAARGKCLKVFAKRRVRRKTAPARLAGTHGDHLVFDSVHEGMLDGVDASAAPGESVAIIGPNGAGKSTLLLLAAGLEAPAGGFVALDGRAPTELKTAERRKALTFIGSRPIILAGSLRRALAMGAAEMPPDDDIQHVARQFGLSNVLDRLDGLDGRISEAGSNLSSGEVRRLLLARARLCAAELLLLDEPDDALDAQGASLVKNLMACPGSTTLIVTHSPDIAEVADKVWYVDSGQIRQRGTFSELMQSNGPVRHFFAARAA